jgi:mannosyltransferase OCH1-like enzyme
MQVHNSDWQEIVWDAAAVLQLAAEHFPWMLPVYNAYPKLVQRSDIARYMILYKHGGVYLDADVSGSHH